jgi:hypothetical protein
MNKAAMKNATMKKAMHPVAFNADRHTAVYRRAIVAAAAKSGAGNWLQPMFMRSNVSPFVARNGVAA